MVYHSLKNSKVKNFGTIISTMVPFSLLFLLGWTVLFVAWFMLGWPIGPEEYMTF
ncbi:AbgT family transporter [Anaerovirgula multivorans]|uniref:AbgT family transporter n=1 Tax=Anaerovirgula multivorans TaxID=312168 RepID=UPI000B78F345